MKLCDTLKNKLTVFAFAIMVFIAGPAFAGEEKGRSGLVRFQKNVSSLLKNSCLKKNHYGVMFYSLDKYCGGYFLRQYKISYLDCLGT